VAVFDLEDFKKMIEQQVPNAFAKKLKAAAKKTATPKKAAAKKTAAKKTAKKAAKKK
jgi:DNA topoisomerase-1